MQGTTKRLILLVLVAVLLQSCYTLLHPPETLPLTVTSVVTEPAMVTSLGGSGYYGWDPYWEPVLPFTSYHRGYGASYYSPYNYYDYHHPYYAPVYVGSEETTPIAGRKYDRDDQLGGSRDRELNSSGASSGSSGGQTSVGLNNGLSTAAPAVSSPVVKTSVVKSPRPSVGNNKSGREVKPIKQKRTSPPPPKNKDSDNSDESSSKKRVRTRN